LFLKKCCYTELHHLPQQYILEKKICTLLGVAEKRIRKGTPYYIKLLLIFYFANQKN